MTGFSDSNSSRIYRRVVTRSLAVLSLTVVLACSGPTELEFLRIRFDELSAEIMALIGDPICENVDQCRYIAYGELPCGGPVKYLVYSTAVTDSVQLQALVDEHRRVLVRIIELENFLSFCNVPPVPILGKVGGRCVDLRQVSSLIWDIEDLHDPILLSEYISENKSIDHNLYIRGNLMYQSNYVGGLRVFDISDPANPVPVGYFDTSRGPRTPRVRRLVEQLSVLRERHDHRDQWGGRVVHVAEAAAGDVLSQRLG